MTITAERAYEAADLSVSDQSSASLPYIVSGTDDDIVAVNAASGLIPFYYGNLVLAKIDLESRLSNESWRVNANYEESTGIGDVDIDQMEFEIGGETRKVIQSLATIDKKNHWSEEDDIDSDPPADYGGTIGITPNGPEGTDVFFPFMNFSKSRRFPAIFVEGGFHNTLSSLIGTVNSDYFKSFEPGEVLFVGCRGSKITLYEYEIFFDFSVSRNAYNLPVGNRVYALKEGWDYLWIDYVEDQIANFVTYVPRNSYIERVYYRKSFTTLQV